MNGTWREVGFSEILNGWEIIEDGASRRERCRLESMSQPQVRGEGKSSEQLSSLGGRDWTPGGHSQTYKTQLPGSYLVLWDSTQMV